MMMILELHRLESRVETLRKALQLLPFSHISGSARLTRDLPDMLSTIKRHVTEIENLSSSFALIDEDRSSSSTPSTLSTSSEEIATGRLLDRVPPFIQRRDGK